MEVLNYILGIIFCTMFFSWILLKIVNVVLVKKRNCEEIYKIIKKDLKKKKITKYLLRVIIIGLIMFAIYLVIGIVAGAVALFMVFITLGGIMYVDTGTDPTFYNNLLDFVGNYFAYGSYFFYIIVYPALVRATYINTICYKKINSDNIKQ